MRVAIVGVGLIGGSIGMALKRRNDIETTGVDTDQAVLERAFERGALDHRASSVADACSDADACFACAPVGLLSELVAEALEGSTEGCVVTDVGSTKGFLQNHTDHERFVGGHPIAGSERAGIDHACAELFENTTWYLTPGARCSGVLYERVHRLVVACGAHPVALDPNTHDELVAAVSHLPHVVANALVLEASKLGFSEREPLLRVGPSFRDATRVAGANPSIWSDIYLNNADAIAAQIDRLTDHLRTVAGWLRDKDQSAISNWHLDAQTHRTRLSETELGGASTYRLVVSVPNRPGVVAQIALALGHSGVNIVDMTLAPASDMRSGAVTLWIAGRDDAKRAKDLIQTLSFSVATEL
jgi:prephenate dehydrogenase